MAETIIFDGDIEFWIDWEYPEGTEAYTQIYNEEAVNTIIAMEDGTEVRGELTSLTSGVKYEYIYSKIYRDGDHILIVTSSPIPEDINNTRIRATRNGEYVFMQMDTKTAYLPSGAGDYHFKLYIYIPEKTINYSASQNGGSIYDNLVELYNSVTGEDPKGHNPSEIIDELKGKIGGGSGNDFEISLNYDSYPLSDTTQITCNKTLAEIVNEYSKTASFPNIFVNGDRCPPLYYSAYYDEYNDSNYVEFMVSAWLTIEQDVSLECLCFSGYSSESTDTWTGNTYRINLTTLT